MAPSDVLFFINRKSFPVKCPELDDFITLMSDYFNIESSDEEAPTTFFRQALARANDHELIIPVTRNAFVRDKLRMEGVNFVICL